MNPVRIKSITQAHYPELEARFEKPLDKPCTLQVGEEWISENCQMPSGFCGNAWQTLYPYVFALANGADNLFDGWMKEPGTAMVSCSDGFRPMSFYLQRLDAKNEA